MADVAAKALSAKGPQPTKQFSPFDQDQDLIKAKSYGERSDPTPKPLALE